MNTWPMRRRFSCGSVTPASAVKKLIFRFHDVQIGFEVRRELADDRRFLVLAQQAVVDQDARQAAARWPAPTAPRRPTESTPPDSPQITRCDRRLARAIRAIGLLGEIVQLPRAVAAADVVTKFARIALPGGVCVTSGMKLQAVDRQPLVLDGRDRAGRGARQRHEIAGDVRHLIAVAHPHFGLLRHAGKQTVGRRLSK